MAAVISSYADLLAAIQSLRPPEPGYIRVFRGQNHNYPTMTPTALRSPYAADALWPIYAGKLADDIKPIFNETLGPDAQDIDVLTLWVQAIKQHYGPGTEFLDVTHSVGVAAWFALHQMELVESFAVYGPPGALNPETDQFGTHTMIRHTRFSEQPGYLYALDVPDNPGASHEREHGTLFDLALAPDAFSSSPRIRVQQACLIYADRAVDGGDLASLVVPGTPLRIAWPLENCPELEWGTNQIFPPAPYDDWYARFISIPLAPSLAKSRGRPVFDHPITVTVYLPEGSGQAEDQALFADLNDRVVTPRPAFLYAEALKTATAENFARHDPLWERFADATALLLEGPMMSATATVDRMNLGVLSSGLADAAPVFDFISGEAAGEVSLCNVFIELSSLDAVGWERFEKDRSNEELLRGVWLVRDGDEFFITIFIHATSSEPYNFGPIKIVYDAANDGPTPFFISGESRLIPLGDHSNLERWFAKALGFVRSLSPRWKLGNSAIFEAWQKDGTTVSYIPLEWALGQVVSLQGLGGPLSSYCALRQWASDEPYYGGARWGSSPAIEGALTLRGQPYAQVKPSEVLAPVQATLAARDQRPPPVGQGSL
jgi:FRG domain